MKPPLYYGHFSGHKVALIIEIYSISYNPIDQNKELDVVGCGKDIVVSVSGSCMLYTVS